VDAALTALALAAAVLYVTGVLVSAVWGWMQYADPFVDRDEERHRAARYVVFCWAWPVVAWHDHQGTLRGILRDGSGTPPRNDEDAP